MAAVSRLGVLLLLASLTVTVDAAPRAARAAFPGENGRIVYASIQAPGGLRTAEPDGSDDTFLTPGTFPAWSPDGQRIAFSNVGQIYTIGADGGNLTQLTDGPPGTSNILPAWSPDGQSIVFLRTSNDFHEIWKMDAGGGNQVKLLGVQSPDSLGFPKWSPDGQRIMFTRGYFDNSGPVNNLYTMTPLGQEVTRITDLGWAMMGDWSPDGTKIVFAVHQGAAGTFLYRANANGSNPVQITTTESQYPVWSPDGTKIMFTSLSSLYTVNPDGSGMTRVLDGVFLYHDWQPLGGALVHSVEFTQGVQDLKTTGALKADLIADGMPPVPIVAGKPAAMRIYMSEVEETTVYELEASGDVSESRFVQLEPGCTPAQRRAHEKNCRSVDFMFTPPPGNWDVTLKVRRQQDSQVLEEHEFHIRSAETVPLVIEPVTVCDDIVHEAAGLWGCGSLFNFVQDLAFLRATFPGTVWVAGSGSSVYADIDEIPAGADWWDVVATNLRSLWAADGALDNVHHFGVVRPQADAGTAGGIAYTRANAAAGKTSILRDDMDGGLPAETAGEVIAQLLGLNAGLKHAPWVAGCYGTPADPDPAWPGASPSIGEVGYDVAEEEPIPETHADVMSLCTPRWISPHTANNLIEAFAPAEKRVAGSGAVATGDFWLVSGSIDQEAEEAGFDPLFELEAEGFTGAGEGEYSIEVRDSSGSTLFTRRFDADSAVREDEGDQPEQDPDIARFFELIPVQANAARIVVLSGADELGELELGGATPVVTLTSGFSRAGAPPLPAFSWEVADGDSAAHTYWVEFSNDGGATWRTIAPRYTGTSLTIDNDITGGGNGLLVRVRASDGANTGVAVSQPFNMQLRPPTGAILSPASGAQVRQGDLVWLQAAAVDPEDGFLDGSAVRWSSNRDGLLGTGTSLHVYDLSLGTHTVTMLATDSDGFEVADSISVTVMPNGVFEGEPLALAGDVNCSGTVDTVDGLGISRFVAGLLVSQTQPCPALGSGDPVFGDVNCDDAVTAVDALFVLRRVAGLPVNLPPGCRPIGT